MNRILVECSECGAEQYTDDIHDGEIGRHTTCEECGAWFTVYEKQ